MSPFRRLISILGLILLLASLALLAGAWWPTQRDTSRQPLTPDDLALPAPLSALPGLALAMGILPQPGPRRQRQFAFAALSAIALLAAACAAAVEPAAPIASPTEAPGASPATLQPLPTAPPTAPIPTALPRPPEARAVEVDYPLSLRVGDSDVIRLSLVVAPEGTYVTPTAEIGGHAASGEAIEIPNVYDTHTVTAIARLDSIGLQIDRPGDWEQPLLAGENLTWRWTVAAQESGRQRANLILRLRFIPREAGEMREREVWARTLTIQASDVFGLPAPLAQGLGVLGSIAGTILGFPFADRFYGWLWAKLRRRAPAPG